MFDPGKLRDRPWTGKPKDCSKASRTTGHARPAGKLLDELHRNGMSVEELRRVVEEDKLVLAPVAQALSSEARYTAREIAEQAGVELDFLTASRRALGLPVPDPDERIYGEKDLEATRLGTLHRAGRASTTRTRSRSPACSARAWPATPSPRARSSPARSSSPASTSTSSPTATGPSPSS